MRSWQEGCTPRLAFLLCWLLRRDRCLLRGPFGYMLGSSAPAQAAWYCIPCFSSFWPALRHLPPRKKHILTFSLQTVGPPCHSRKVTELCLMLQGCGHPQLPLWSQQKPHANALNVVLSFSVWVKLHWVHSSHWRSLSATLSYSGRTGKCSINVLQLVLHKSPASDLWWRALPPHPNFSFCCGKEQY